MYVAMQSHKTTAKRDSFVHHIFYAQTACLYISAADGPSQISPSPIPYNFQFLHTIFVVAVL